MKLIRRILAVLILLIVAAVSLLLFRGQSLYRTTVAQMPIEEAASQYLEMDGYLSYDEIDADFVNAVIAVEDKRFFERHGYDWIALARAVINNFRYKSAVEGGSTISQQIAKNLYYQTRTRGIDEKVAEVFIMHDLEDIYSKEELFALYSNMNYYGDGFWGLRQAAQGYYGVSADNLSIAKAAMLAGIPNAPGAYQLSTGYDLARSRQKKVLSRMLATGYISQEEYNAALEEDVYPVQ